MNPTFRRLLAGFAGSLLAIAAATADERTEATVLAAPPGTATAPPYDLQVLLDRNQSDAARTQELQALRAAADSGDHPARCLLGRLGFRKDTMRSTLPDGDYGDPVGYLNACALGGDLDAMLVLAEAELNARRPLEAMIWMQTHIQLANAIGPDTVRSGGSYKAGLIARIERAYGGVRPSNEEVFEYVAGVVDAHGERIVAGCRAGGCDWAQHILPPRKHELQSSTRSRPVTRSLRDWSRDEDNLTTGSFMVEVDEQGRTVAATPIEVYPDASAERRLQNLARGFRYNAAPAGTGNRVAVVRTGVHVVGFEFLPDAAPTTRTRVRGD